MWGQGGTSNFVLCFGVLVLCWCWQVLWIVFKISVWDLVGALCFGLYLGFRCGTWELLVYCGFGRVDLVGGLRNGVKV